MSAEEHHNALQYFLEVKGLAQFSKIIHHEFGSLMVLATANRDALVLAGIRNENMLNTFIRSIADLNKWLEFFDPCGTTTWRCRSCGDTCPDFQLDVHLEQKRCFPDMQKLQIGVPRMQAHGGQAGPSMGAQAMAPQAGAQALAAGGMGMTVADVLRESGVCENEDHVQHLTAELARIGADAVSRLALVSTQELENLQLPPCMTRELARCFSSLPTVALPFQKGMRFEHWLAAHELSVYEGEFRKMGFKTLTTIRSINQNDAVSMGIQKEIHLRQLFISLALTRNQ